MPFELILEIVLGIDTIFKPFRIISLAIISVYVIKVFKEGMYLNGKEWPDLLLYAIFTYGLLISFVRMISGLFHYGYFFNDIFQSGLYLATFFIFKSLPISKQQGFKILKILMLGIFLNAFSIFFTFLFGILNGRQSGFTDNPNYAALGLVAATVFFLLRTNYISGLKNHLMHFGVLLFIIYIFIMTGSRTGLVMFLVANILIFIYSSFRRKITILAISGLVVLVLLPQDLEKATLGGPLVLIRRVINKNAQVGVEDVRFPIWRGVGRVLEDYGYMGVGIGQFKAKFPRYFREEPHAFIVRIVDRGYYLSTHNDYLAILIDYGLLSLVFYLSYLFFSFRKILGRMIYSKEEDDRFLGQYNFILLTCLVIFGLTAENFQHQLFWFLLMFITKSFTNSKSVIYKA